MLNGDSVLRAVPSGEENTVPAPQCSWAASCCQQQKFRALRGTFALCNEVCGEIPDLGVAVVVPVQGSTWASEFCWKAKTMSQSEAVLLSGLLRLSGDCSNVTPSCAARPASNTVQERCPRLVSKHGIALLGWLHPSERRSVIVWTRQNPGVISHRLFTHVAWKMQLVLLVFSMTRAPVRAGCFCSFSAREHYGIWTSCFGSASW